MSRTSTLILLGILTTLTPFSGLPVSIRTLLAVVLGAGVAATGLIMRAEEAHEQRQASDSQPTAPIAVPESVVTPSEMSAF